MLQLLLLIVLGVLVVYVFRQARLVARGGVALKPRGTARVLAVLILGIGLGLFVNWDHSQQRAGGREAFLKRQVKRFDSHISKPHSLVPDAVFGLVFVGAAVGVYELIAWGISFVSQSSRKHGAA